jgi:VCBS repeat-containing protein
MNRLRGGRPQRNLFRRHSLEALERRELLAADAFAFVDQLSAEGEGEPASIVPEIQSGASSVSVGDSFSVRVLVQDMRAVDPNPNNFDPNSGEPIEDRGLFAVSTDLTFNPALSGIPLAQFLATSQAAQHFGTTYANGDLSSLDQRVGAGTIRITGATANLLTPPGDDQLLYATIPFKVGAVADFASVDEDSSITINVLANDTSAGGTQTIATEYVDSAGQVVLFFVESSAGENRNGQGVAEGDIVFGTDTISVNVPGAPTLTSVSNPANGTATITGGQIQYTPDPDFFGTETFTYTISYPGGATDTATVTVTVNNLPDDPVAGDDFYTTDKGTVLTRSAPGVLQNDTDPDIDPALSPENNRNDRITITASDSTSQRGAAVTVNADGSFTYNPTGVAEFQALGAGQSLTDTFTYTISDKAGATDTATVTVTVTGDPTAQPAIDKVAFAQALVDAGVEFFGAAWCPFCTEQKELFEDGGRVLNMIEVTNPDRSLNQIGQENNISTFPTWDIPDPDNPGETIRLTGVQSLQTLAETAGIEIPLGSDPFLAPIENVTLLAGAPLHVALDGYDPNGTQLTYTVQVSGANINAQVLEGNRSMRIDMAGYGDMVFQLFDQEVPRVTNAIAGLAEDGVYDDVIFHRVINNFVIQGGDPTGTGFGDPSLPRFDDQFHFDLQHTQSGILSMAKAGDDTNSSQFFITEVNPSNPRQLRSLDFNHSVFGYLVEGHDVREAISNTATNAQDRPTNTVRMETVEIFMDQENGVLRLKAAPGVTGTATVTVTATDVEGRSTQRTFNVTVEADPFNGGPFLSDIPPITTAINTPVSFQLEGNDVEGDAMRFTAVLPQGANPTFNFTVNENTGEVTVTPPTGFSGTLELLVGVRPQTTSDTGDAVDTQLVEIQVAPAAPTSVDLAASSDSGVLNDDNITNASELLFTIGGVQNGALVELFVNGQAIGSATASGSSATVTTNNAALLTEGVHEFTARQTVDGARSAASAALSVTIDRTAPPAITSTAPTEAAVGSPYIYDAENPEETNPGVFYTLVNPPTGMTINQTTGVVSWTPSSSQEGSQSFGVRARDAAGNQSPVQNITVTVISGPGRGDTYETEEETTLTVTAENGVLANDDPDNELGRPLTAQLVQGPQNGEVQLNADGSFTYTPKENFQGIDTFTYRASDGENESNVTTVAITVTNTPDPPVAVNDTYTVAEDDVLQVSAAAGVLANDQNPDDEVLTASVVAGPANGQIVLNANGSFTYTPTANFHGTDSFTYRVTAASGLMSNTATVTFNVTPENDAPVAHNDSYSVNEDATLTVGIADSILANDVDVDGDALIAFLVSEPQNGTLNFNGQNGTFTYTPNPNFHGVDTFTYRASDNQINSNLATVTITVNNVNDPPVVQPLTFTSTRNAPETFYPLADFANRISDPDPGPQTFRVTAVGSGSRGGTLRVAQDGSGFFYRPAADVTGTETFSITIADAENATTTVTATMTIQDFTPGSLAGFVYLDHNNNGELDDGEGRIGGVQLTLTGTTSTGTAISQRQTTTAADGSYRFDNLAPGTYTIRQTQPSLLVDGKETPGSQGGASNTNDQITVTLAEGVDGTGNNFGEMRPASSYSILDFLFVKPTDSVLASVGSNSDNADWFVIESGWDDIADFDARLNTAGTSATVNIQESDGDRFRAQNVASPDEFRSLATNGVRSLIRFFGDRSDFNFQSVSTSSAQAEGEGEAATLANSTSSLLAPEGEAENTGASELLVGAHDFSIRDFLFTRDVTLSSPAPAPENSTQQADAVDVVMSEIAEGEGEADARPTSDQASAGEFLDALDLLFEEDAGL